MGWDPARVGGREFLILSTQGGIRAPDGKPVALGFHTGHWEVGLLMEEAARTISGAGAIPFAAYCSDPCDGRTNGTAGMLDSLPYRNDAATVFRRLIRSLPTRRGVLGVATCDKGLPAMMMALAGTPGLPTVLVPGGVMLIAEGAEDTAKVQTLSARYAHGEVSLETAAEMGCRACGSPGGGCQFMGTAATSQVVGEALGLSLPHSALSPSGAPIWRDMARRSALALMDLDRRAWTTADVLTEDSIHNALVLHAAFGGSTNLVLHLPAIARSAGLRAPTVAEWTRINRMTPRLVDVLPNGPTHYATVQVFLAGGVPEVMLKLREAGLLRLEARTVSGQTLGRNLEWWESSGRRARVRELLKSQDGIDPDRVILSPAAAAAAGLSSTVAFLEGNLAPEGALVKSTAISRDLIGGDGLYLHEGPVRFFGTEQAAIDAIKSNGPTAIRAGDVVVLAGIGPAIGMPETYQVTSALKYLKEGRAGRTSDRRAVFRRIHRGLHRARQPRGALRRAPREAPGRGSGPDPDRHPRPRGLGGPHLALDRGTGAPPAPSQPDRALRRSGRHPAVGGPPECKRRKLGRKLLRCRHDHPRAGARRPQRREDESPGRAGKIPPGQDGKDRNKSEGRSIP